MSAGVQVQSTPAVGMTRRRGYKGKLWAYIGLTLGFALSAFPLYYMLVLAMDKRGGIAVMAWPPVLTPYWPLQFDNFVYALTAVNFGRYFLNSTIISTLVVIGTILSSSVAGYVFARMRFHGRDVLFIVMLATMMIPTQVTLIPSSFCSGPLDGTTIRCGFRYGSRRSQALHWRYSCSGSSS